MCVSNPRPQEVAKQVVQVHAEKQGKWLEGWKVLRRIVFADKVVLKSMLANDEWTPGIIKAKPARMTGFTGGELPDNKFGIHVLMQRPPVTSFRPGETLIRVYVNSDDVQVVGDDTSGHGHYCTTLVAHSVKVEQADYEEAIKGNAQPRPETVKGVEESKKEVVKTQKAKKEEVKKAVKEAVKNVKKTKKEVAKKVALKSTKKAKKVVIAKTVKAVKKAKKIVAKKKVVASKKAAALVKKVQSKKK